MNVEQFRKYGRQAFRFLVEECGFREAALPDSKFVNEYMVCFSNGVTWVGIGHQLWVRASVSPEWPLVKAQQKRPVFIGQFGVVARSSKRGRKSPAISRNPLSAGAVARRNHLQSDQA